MINDTFQKQKYLYLVFFLFFAQFFILDAYYFDDLFRAHEGYFGWSGDGRALGGILYKILQNFQSPLADIYPVPIIITGFFFCFIIYHLCQAFKITKIQQQCIILFLLIANPLALSNWLFRYDSAFMLLSIAFALIPFCIRNLPTKKWMFYSSLSLVGVLMTYQISLNIFIGFTAIVAFQLVIENQSFKKILYFISLSIIIVIITYLFYVNIILKILPTHEYAAQFRKISNFTHILDTIQKNSLQSYEFIKTLLKSGLGVPYSILILCNLYAINKIKNNTRVLCMYIIALMTTIFAINGVMLFSPNAPFYSRTFLGIISTLVFPIITLALFNHYKLFLIAGFYLCINILVVDRAALNATSAEIKHQNIIAQQIMTEASINHITEIEHIMILGTPRKSGIAQISQKTYPIVSQILPHSFSGSYDGGRYIMMFNGYDKTTYPEPLKQEQITQKIKYTSPIASNPLYQLYYIDQILIVNFEN